MYCINLYRKLFKISTLAFIFLTDYCLLTPKNVLWWKNKCLNVALKSSFIYLNSTTVFGELSCKWAAFVSFVPTHPESHWFLSAGNQLLKFLKGEQQAWGQWCIRILHTHKTATHTFISVAFFHYTDTFSFYYYTQLSFRFVLFISFCSSCK